MKREALHHSKMKRLCRFLDIRLYGAVGIMESLWHLTAKEAPQGDIGKLSNEDIAEAIGWTGPEDRIIEALIHAKWLDPNPNFRLIVHDWHEHCEDSVHMRLARLGLLFANGTRPKMARLSSADREKAEKVYESLTLQKADLCAQTTNSCAQNEDLCALPKSAQTAESCALVESAQNGEVCALPCHALPSHAMPCQATPHQALPDFAHDAKLATAQNGASAILKSSKNGKAHEPSEPELDAFSIWAHAVYQRHPKQKNLHDTLWTLKQKFANRPDDQKLLDENHPLWIAYWQLDPSYPRFVPGLADRDGRGWLNDQVWRKPPPPPPDTRTKNQIANDAVYQKFMAEAERKEKLKEKAQ